MDLQSFYRITAYIIFGILGLCVGSFLNVVIYRVPNKMNIAFPASHCPNCNAKIKWYDNIPVLSYCILKAKCRNCGEHISFRYTIVEILNAVLWLLSVYRFWRYGIWLCIINAVAISILICICFIDLENMIILDRFQLMLLVLAIINIFLDKSRFSSGFYGLHHIIGGTIGFGVLYLIGFIGELIVGKEALGGGDIKLCGVMGLFLGWQNFIFAMLLASLSASIVLITLRKKNGESGREYPFAPFLTISFIIAMLFGDSIVSAYFSLLI